jgi:hypothetical protein
MPWEVPMPERASLLMLAAVGAMLSACVSQQETVRGREDLLAAAGFTVRPANTPARQAGLRALPANRFVQQARGDRVVYLYADPLVCNCLYIGDPAAYGRYQQEMLQRQIARDRLMTAEMNADAAWDWGPWGWGY